MQNLGTSHLVGLGVQQDPVTAMMWFLLAAELDNEDGIEAAEDLAGLLTEAERSEAERRAQLCRTAAFRDCG